MGPQTYRWWKAAKRQEDKRLRFMLESAQHFLIDCKIFEVVDEIVWNEVDKAVSDKSYDPPYFWDLPGPLLVVEAGDLFCFIVKKTESGVVFWNVQIPFKPEGHMVFNAKEGLLEYPAYEGKWNLLTDREEGIWSKAAMQLEVLFSLIQQPRIVRQSRPEKDKSGMRARGINPRKVSWQRISWWPEQEVCAKASNGRGSPKALHFARAYWARAKEGEPKATNKRPLPDRSGFYPGWWRKVRHSWRGDPKYGVVLHHNTPRMSREDQNQIERRTGDDFLNKRMAEALENQWSENG